MLRFPSSPTKPCATCKSPIHWIDTTHGRRMPVDPDGTSHFATCPQAAQHRRPTLKKLTHEQVADAVRRVASGESPTRIARALGVRKFTIQEHVRRRSEQ